MDKEPKKKRNTRKWVIPLVITSIFTFTGISMWLQYTTGSEVSSTLTTCFYSFCGGELWLLASITKAKVRNDSNSVDDISNNIDEDSGGQG